MVNNNNLITTSQVENWDVQKILEESNKTKISEKFNFDDDQLLVQNVKGFYIS